MPYVPSLYQYSDNIERLLLHAADNRAASQRESGERWGNTIAGLGHIAGQAVGQYQEQKAATKHDAAVADLWERSQGNPEPKDLIKMYGYEKGSAIAKDVAQWNAAKMKKGQDALAGLPASVGLMKKLSPALREGFYQREFRPAALASGLLTEETAPPNLTDDFFKQIEGLAPEVERQLMTVNQGDTVIDKGTGQPVYTAPPKPVESPKLGTLEAFMTDKYGAKPTPEQQYAARKEWETANDPAKDPVTAELARRQLKKMQDEDAGNAESAKAFEAVPKSRRTAIERVTNSMTKDKRANWDRTLRDLAVTGDDESLKSALMQAATESERVGSQTQIQGRSQMTALLNDALGTLKEMKTRGVPSNILSGSVEDVARKLGTSTNPEYVRLGNSLMDTLITYRKAATGAAFSDKESRQYESMFPNYRNTFPVNEALIQGMLKTVNTNSRTFWKSKVGDDAADWLLGMGTAGGPPVAPPPMAGQKPPAPAKRANPFRK